MRFIAVILILLAGGKVGYQEYLYRASTSEVMVTAFKEQAVAACQRDATAAGLADRAAWANPAQVWFGVGNPRAEVSVWQIDHARWSERYRTPFLGTHARRRSAPTISTRDGRWCCRSASRDLPNCALTSPPDKAGPIRYNRCRTPKHRMGAA
jgi:hypothetical protein